MIRHIREYESTPAQRSNTEEHNMFGVVIFPPQLPTHSPLWGPRYGLIVIRQISEYESAPANSSHSKEHNEVLGVVIFPPQGPTHSPHRVEGLTCDQADKRV